MAIEKQRKAGAGGNPLARRLAGKRLAAQTVLYLEALAPRLLPILCRSFPTIHFVPRGIEVTLDESERPEFQVALGSLCRWLRADLARFPAHAGYLSADPERTESLRQRYRAQFPGRRLIGISWRGGSRGPDVDRSMALAQWADILRLPDLARTLQRIADKGAAGFYQGETADLIAAEMKAHGGIITVEDLKNYQAKKREPIRGTYRGYEILSMPPPSSGGTALVEMLNVLEGYDLKASGFGSADTVHLIAESMRRAYADRALHLGDADFNPPLPIDRLTSKTMTRLS